MTPTLLFPRLLGRWRTVRVIRLKDGPTVRFEGITEWAPSGDVLRAVEQGQMVQQGASFEARRETLWQLSGPAIDVSFADGRPFHTIDRADVCRSHHDCPPDTYVLRYDFRAWPLWSVRWQVTGPRKDYTALTRYRKEG